MRKLAAAVAAVAGVALLGVSAVAVVTADQPGPTRSIGRLLSAEAVSPSPSQAPEHHNASDVEHGTAQPRVAENEQCEDETGTGNDSEAAENEQGDDETCTGNDSDVAEHQQGKDELGTGNQSDMAERR